MMNAIKYNYHTYKSNFIYLYDQNATIKTKQECLDTFWAGWILNNLFNTLSNKILKWGLKVIDIDRFCFNFILKYGAEPICKSLLIGTYTFPYVACISVNRCIAHGTINPEYVLRYNDKVSIDIVFWFKGILIDACRTFLIRRHNKLHHIYDKKFNILYECSIKLQKIILKELHWTFNIKNVHNVVDHFIQSINVHSLYKIKVISRLNGHFIGRHIHEKPSISFTEYQNQSFDILPGMSFTIEPILIFDMDFNYVHHPFAIVIDRNIMSFQYEDTFTWIGNVLINNTSDYTKEEILQIYTLMNNWKDDTSI